MSHAVEFLTVHTGGGAAGRESQRGGEESLWYVGLVVALSNHCHRYRYPPPLSPPHSAPIPPSFYLASAVASTREANSRVVEQFGRKRSEVK